MHYVQRWKRSATNGFGPLELRPSHWGGTLSYWTVRWKADGSRFQLLRAHQKRSGRVRCHHVCCYERQRLLPYRLSDTWKLSRARATINQTITSRAHNGCICRCIPAMTAPFPLSSLQRTERSTLDWMQQKMFMFLFFRFLLSSGLEEKRVKQKTKGFRSDSTSAPFSAPSGDSSGTPWFVSHQQKARPSLGIDFCIFLHCFKSWISLSCLWQPPAKALKEKKPVNPHVVASICLDRKLP